ncbi:MAG: M24 family metallopeptidase [Candidatus Hodarchaeota archaeon]
MRLDRVQRVMSREEIKGILLFDPFNIRYLTGYKPGGVLGSSVAVLSQEKEPWLIVPQAELKLATSSSWFQNIFGYHRQGTPETKHTLFNRLQEAIEQHKLQSIDIGVELNYISARRFEELKRLLPDAGFKNITASLNDLRMIKDEAEIEKLKTATQIAENGVRAALEFVQPGISEIEVAAEVERTLRRAGATGTGFPTVITTGPRTSCSYAPASRREIGPFESVIISVSAISDDYCSNVTRTVMTGKPSKKFVTLFNCAQDAIAKTQNQLTPETIVRDVALRIQRIAEERECLPYLHDTHGSSVGLQPFEPPHFIVSNETPLRPGMVFTIECGLFKPDVGGVYLSNTNVFHRDGTFETLNQIPLETI